MCWWGSEPEEMGLHRPNATHTETTCLKQKSCVCGAEEQIVRMCNCLHARFYWVLNKNKIVSVTLFVRFLGAILATGLTPCPSF